MPVVNALLKATPMIDPRDTFSTEPVVDLSDFTVGVLGCGTVGAAAAWAAASAGVRRFELADRDHVARNNLRRHVCDATEIGRPKADAVARYLQNRFPQTAILSHELSFLSDPTRLRELIARSDVVLVAVDHEAPKYLINTMAWELGRPAIYAGVYGGGWGSEVILADPTASTPCYGCAARALGRSGIDVTLPQPNPFYALPVEGVPTDAWPRADLTSILPAAALAARFVIAWLAARRGRPNDLSEFLQSGSTAWRFAIRRVAAWQLGPWSLEPVPVPRDPDCPVCVPANKLDIPPRFRSLFKEEPP